MTLSVHRILKLNFWIGLGFRKT